MESRTPPPVKTETIADVRAPLDVSRLSLKSATDRPPKVRGRLTVWMGVAWLTLITLLAIFANLLPIASYSEIVGRPRQKPFQSWDYPLGTDNLGRSELSRAIYGARSSLVVGVFAVAIGMLIGSALGLLAGHFRGKLDAVMGIVTDAFLAFPALVMLLAIAATMGASLRNLVVALAILTTPAFVRLARANTMVFANREFIRAARGLGAGNRRIITRELLPNVSLPVASYAFVLIAVVLVAEGSLSFLGLGVPPPRPSWGEMISTGRNELDRAPHIVFVPATFMFLTVWSFNVLGDHARRRFDTRVDAVNPLDAAQGLSLGGKVILVTGAARGIGEAIARRCARAGATVVCADVLDEIGLAVAESMGRQASYVSIDVADEHSWRAVADTLVDTHGGVDVLVNNAGVLHTAAIADTSVDDYLRLVSVNQLGCFLGMRTAAPLMVSRGGGSIVNLSSALGMVGMSGMVAYTATKFAIRGMTKAAALELGPSGIRVNSVHPTGVITPMSDPARFGRADRDVSRIPLRRLADVDEIAQLVGFLASDASSYCTGSEFIIDGGVLAGQAS